MYKVLERMIVDRLIRHREETTRDEEAGFRPGRSTIDQVVTGVRQGAVAGPFLFNFAIDDIIRRTVDYCPAYIILAPSGRPLTDLEYADDVLIFEESSTKL
ncbi:hypothetical protein RB195_022788 [Necator americanus]|uniref:Reverse transcriptase domain-containing protein n=1 Tax=Necator americanus TaxID=51031 RepID=A0ABR1EGT2_NECAM